MLLRSNNFVYLSIFFLFMAVLLACEGATGLQGEQGAQGHRGVQGDSTEISIITGILPTGDYWFFEFIDNLENSIIMVYVRETPADLWFEPEWCFFEKTIYILKDEFVEPGFEYRILIAQ